MAYAQGDLILKDHYNTFAMGDAGGIVPNHTVSNINSVWGTGFGDKGYGQSTTVPSVITGELITASQWTTLIQRLNTLLAHQSGTTSGISLPTTGSIIQHLSTLSGNVTAVNTNRLLFNNTRGTTTTGANLDGVWNAASPISFQQVRTVTFSNADNMRYFFNAGGRINLVLSTVSGTDTAKEIAWTNLLTTGIGTLSFDAATSTRSGTGYTVTINGSSLGFWDGAATDQTLIRLTDTTAAYTSNYVNINYRITGATGTNGGLGTVITFTIDYVDVASDTFDDAINMTMRTRIDIIRPETTNLTDVWGTITVAVTTN